MAMIYSPQEKATEVEEKMIIMHPKVEKGPYTKTHDHVIYSSCLSNKGATTPHYSQPPYHTQNEQRFIVLERATDLPLNYVLPRILLG